MAEQTNKLKIIRGTGSSRATFDQSKKDTVIEICFNPTQYSLDKKNTFSEAKIPGLGSPIIQFSQGDSRTLSLELMLDTYRYGKGEDLREKYIKPLEKLINIDEEIHAPPPAKSSGGPSSLSACWTAFENNIPFSGKTAHRSVPGLPSVSKSISPWISRYGNPRAHPRTG